MTKVLLALSLLLIAPAAANAGERASCNQYGCWHRGGGCNQYGCWRCGGSCNQYGCTNDGVCTQYGCP